MASPKHPRRDRGSGLTHIGVVVASYAASVAASMEKLAGLAGDHPVFPASAALLKSALQPVAAPGAVSAQGADLLVMLSGGSRGAPAPPAAKLQAWRRDFACRPPAPRPPRPSLPPATSTAGATASWSSGSCPRRSK